MQRGVETDPMVERKGGRMKMLRGIVLGGRESRVVERMEAIRREAGEEGEDDIYGVKDADEEREEAVTIEGEETEPGFVGQRPDFPSRRSQGLGGVGGLTSRMAWRWRRAHPDAEVMPWTAGNATDGA
jgi:hypothetical protein